MDGLRGRREDGVLSGAAVRARGRLGLRGLADRGARLLAAFAAAREALEERPERLAHPTTDRVRLARPAGGLHLAHAAELAVALLGERLARRLAQLVERV